MLKRRRAIAAGVFLLLLVMIGVQVIGQIRVLFIDETQTFETSLRLEVLARRLKASGMFVISAQLSIPEKPWEGEAYQCAVIVPDELPFIWLCSAGTDAVLPISLQQAKQALTEAIIAAFQGLRVVLGVDDDFFAFLWSAHLLRLGVLQEVGTLELE